MNQDQAEEPLQPLDLTGTIPVDNVDDFARHVATWHQNKVSQLKHLLEIPEGTAFTIGDGTEETELVLEGPALAGFKFGIEMALMQFGELPFVIELEDAPTSTTSTTSPVPEAGG